MGFISYVLLTLSERTVYALLSLSICRAHVTLGNEGNDTANGKEIYCFPFHFQHILILVRLTSRDFSKKLNPPLTKVGSNTAGAGGGKNCKIN